jgi:hypothetical protein
MILYSSDQEGNRLRMKKDKVDCVVVKVNDRCISDRDLPKQVPVTLLLCYFLSISATVTMTID